MIPPRLKKEEKKKSQSCLAVLQRLQTEETNRLCFDKPFGQRMFTCLLIQHLAKQSSPHE